MVTAEQLIARFPTIVLCDHAEDRVVFIPVPGDDDHILLRHRDASYYLQISGGPNRRGSSPLPLIRDYLKERLAEADAIVSDTRKQVALLRDALDLGD